MQRGVLLGLALYVGYWVLIGLVVGICFTVSEWRERRRCEREQLLRLWYTVLLSGESPFVVYQNHYGSGQPVEFPPGAISRADPGGVRLVRRIGPTSGEVIDGD